MTTRTMTAITIAGILSLATTTFGYAAERNARSKVGIEGAPRIGAKSRLEAPTTTVGGSGGSKALKPRPASTTQAASKSKTNR